ncbi:MAG: hypothetical protein ACKO7B_18760 [Flavobacteriales bacterium]
MVKSFLNIDIPFVDFLNITEIRQIHELSVYWSCDGVFHETTSAGIVQKEDLLRFLNENQCELISVHFLCNGLFEIESNGRNETVISVHEPSIIDVEERNRDFLERDDLMSSLEESDKRKAAVLLKTRIVE